MFILCYFAVGWKSTLDFWKEDAVCVGKLSLKSKLSRIVKGNVGFVFTKEDLADVRDLILANKVAAPAKAGALAPIDVFVPKGNTGLGPEKTSFFQALAIPTKIAKGTIEILVSMCLCCCAVKLRALCKSENWPAGLWLDQSF